MKKAHRILIAVMIFSVSSSMAWAQRTFVESKPSPSTLSCRSITLHCNCTNPLRKFTVRDQKVGRVNPGDPGICESSIYIDEWLQKNSFTACVRGEQGDFDPSRAPSCTATWECKEVCSEKK